MQEDRTGVNWQHGCVILVIHLSIMQYNEPSSNILTWYILCNTDSTYIILGATCIDKTNYYECKCAPGYQGKLCKTNIDECQPNPCKNSGTCTDAINDYKCTCLNSWGGKDCSRSTYFSLNLCI